MSTKISRSFRGLCSLSARFNTSLRSALVLLLTLFFLVSAGHAQTDTATLSGTVLDQNSAVVPGVDVTVRNYATGFERHATTNESGLFTISLLPPGTYTVTAQRQGFKRVQIPDLVVNVGDRKALEIQLKVGETSESVTVNADDVAEVRTDGSVGTVVTRNQIANMPLNGRSLHALIQLTPGVVLTTAGGGTGATGQTQFSVNGQRTNSNYFMVDGVGANTGMSIGTTINLGSAGTGTAPGTTILGGTNSLVSLDALQEFRIETSSYAAEYGRTPGGQISLVTRGGTNHFHGSGSYYFRNEALDANEWFANSRNQPRARERQSLFSGVFGGPIFLPGFGEGTRPILSGRDKAFFFLSYEGLRLEQPKTGNPLVPTTLLRSQVPATLRPYLNALPLPNGPGNSDFAEFDATYSDPSSFNIWSARLDTNITKTLTGFLRINHAPSKGEARTFSLSTITHQEADQNSITGGGTWLAAKTLTLDVRMNWTKNFAHQFLEQTTFGGAVIPDPSQIFLPGWDPSNAVFNFVASSSPGFVWGQGSSNVQRQFNVVATASQSLGPHQLKYGVDYRRLLPVIKGGSAPIESVGFSSANNLRNGLASYTITNVDPFERKPIIPSLSLFAQDTWRVTSRLTLTYGLRFERVPPPSDAIGQLPRTLLGIENNAIVNPRLAPVGTPLWNSRFGEFAPRLGVAYQLSGRKGWETSVRGGAGIFYDLGYGSIADAFSNAYPFRVQQSFGTIPFPPPSSTRIPPVLNGPIPNGAQFFALDPDLRLPYTIQWNGSWEQAIGAKQSLTVTYVGAAGRRLLLLQSASNVQLADNPGANVSLFIQRGAARSSYRALQTQFQRRLDRRFQVLASYTLSSSRDNASAEGDFAPSASVSTLLAQEWGPSSFDARHVVSAAVTYEVPTLPGPHLVESLARDWGLDLLVRYQSAFPLNIVASSLRINSITAAARPNLVSGQPLYLEDASVPGGRRINKAAFVAAPTGQQGDFPRNGVRGFSARQIDLALRREFKLGERVKLQLRGEFFNVFNQPNFAGIDTTWVPTSTTFGVSRNTLGKALGGLNALYQMGGPRSGQLSVKLLF